MPNEVDPIFDDSRPSELRGVHLSLFDGAASLFGNEQAVCPGESATTALHGSGSSAPSAMLRRDWGTLQLRGLTIDAECCADSIERFSRFVTEADHLRVKPITCCSPSENAQCTGISSRFAMQDRASLRQAEVRHFEDHLSGSQWRLPVQACFKHRVCFSFNFPAETLAGCRARLRV